MTIDLPPEGWSRYCSPQSYRNGGGALYSRAPPPRMQIGACGLLWDFCLHCGCILMAYEDGPSPPLDSYSVDYCSLPPCMIFVLESAHCPGTRKINGCKNSKIFGRCSERQTACTTTISVITSNWSYFHYFTTYQKKTKACLWLFGWCSLCIFAMYADMFAIRANLQIWTLQHILQDFHTLVRTIGQFPATTKKIW